MASSSDDPASDVLWLPLQEGALAWPAPGRTLVVGARAGFGLQSARAHAPVCVQTFRPWATALERDGFAAVADADGEFPLVLVRAPRQRQESRAVLARALAQAGADGVVVACAGNHEGGRTLQGDLAALAGAVHSRSKAHCRVCWTAPGARAHAPGLRAEWAAADAPRPILDGRFVSRPGVFAWDRIDAGTALLAAHLPADLAGAAADLGAGIGVLAAALLQRCPGIAALDLYEADARALALARTNLAAATVPLGFHWHDVAGGLPGKYDVVVSNPPFHQGRADAPDLGRAFIVAAAAALRPGGRLWLVANRHLPYEATLAQGFAQVRTVHEDAGFKVIEARRSGR